MRRDVCASLQGRTLESLTGSFSLVYRQISELHLLLLREHTAVLWARFLGRGGTDIGPGAAVRGPRRKDGRADTGTASPRHFKHLNTADVTLLDRAS